MTYFDDMSDRGAVAVASDEPNLALRATNRTYPLVREFLRHGAARKARSFLARVFGFNPLPAGTRALYRGAVGEIAVSDALAQLGPDWVVLDSVPVAKDGGDVNHVVIGPCGVYTIAVRNHAGSAIWVGGAVVLVDGERVPHIRDAEFEAVRAAQLLSDAVGFRIEVTPCLVVIDPRSLTVARPPRRVAILTPRELRPWLKGLAQVYPRDQLDQLGPAAQQRETWHDRPLLSDDALDALTQFRRVQADVNQARRLRLTWITGGLVLLWLGALVGIGGFAAGLLFH